MSQKLGPTGEFPRGKLDESDEGAIQLGMAADHENGVVRIHFGKPIAWIGLTRDQAMDFAALIIEKAKQLTRHQ